MPAEDPHRLDADGDGEACEGLPEGRAGRSFRGEPSGGSDGGRVPYDRSLWKHWADLDGDCMDVREEVLAAESDPGALRVSGCEVVAGRWLGPYTGRIFTDPADLHVDHVVPLKEAHVSGGYAWSPRRRRAFANDVRHPEALAAVSASANMSKGAGDPAEWLPPDRDRRCSYVRSWKRVKEISGLSMDPAERRAVRRILRRC